MSCLFLLCYSCRVYGIVVLFCFGLGWAVVNVLILCRAASYYLCVIVCYDMLC